MFIIQLSQLLLIFYIIIFMIRSLLDGINVYHIIIIDFSIIIFVVCFIRSDIGPNVGFEATGIIDSKLPTVGIWSRISTEIFDVNNTLHYIYIILACRYS